MTSIAETASAMIAEDPALAAEICRQMQKPRMSLTQRQADALQVITERHAKDKKGLTVGEIAQALGVSSKSSAHRLVVALEQRGYITREANKARCIHLIEVAA